MRARGYARLQDTWPVRPRTDRHSHQRPDRLRHTFATERLRSGMALEKLQVMLGHSTLQQTLAYAEIVNADVQTEADRTADAFARNLGLAVSA